VGRVVVATAGSVLGDDVVVAPGGLAAPARLAVPPDSRGLVLVACGSGSGRADLGDQFVAERLVAAGVTTLLVDLCAEADGRDVEDAFEPEVLAVRLLAATRWARRHPSCRGLGVGYFGAGWSADVAVLAAAEDPSIGALVLRDGSLEPAGDRLSAIFAPTLLIVGSADRRVLELNEQATRRLRSEHRLVVIPGATNHFEERGALQAVADHAVQWFVRHFAEPAIREDLGL
jgi:putative phosphoribosyl transferase